MPLRFRCGWLLFLRVDQYNFAIFGVVLILFIMFEIGHGEVVFIALDGGINLGLYITV